MKDEVDFINTYPLFLIKEERKYQIKKGFDFEHDDSLKIGQLANMAACYAIEIRDKGAENIILRLNPLPNKLKINTGLSSIETDKDRIKDLVIAGALIVAEIEKLQRLGVDAIFSKNTGFKQLSQGEGNAE